MRALLTAIVVLAALPSPAGAQAQARDWPSRTVRIVVTTTPGTSADLGARFLAEQLTPVFGQPFVVDNRAGADGAVGVAAVKSAPADGYTIMLASNSPVSVNPVVVKDLPYDPVKDLKPVCGLLQSPNVYVVAGDAKVQGLHELLDGARKAGRALNVATSFPGYKLSAEWLASLAGVKFNHVSYKGTPQVIADVAGGHVDMGLVDRAVAAPLVKAGKLRALGIGGEKRSPLSPEIPTLQELGFADYVSFSWISLFVRAETPDDVVAKLADAVERVMKSDAAAEFVNVKLGAQPMPLGTAAMRRFQLEELERNRRVAVSAGMQPQ